MRVSVFFLYRVDRQTDYFSTCKSVALKIFTAGQIKHYCRVASSRFPVHDQATSLGASGGMLLEYTQHKSKYTSHNKAFFSETFFAPFVCTYIFLLQPTSTEHSSSFFRLSAASKHQLFILLPILFPTKHPVIPPSQT